MPHLSPQSWHRPAPRIQPAGKCFRRGRPQRLSPHHRGVRLRRMARSSSVQSFGFGRNRSSRRPDGRRVQARGSLVCVIVLSPIGVGLISRPRNLRQRFEFTRVGGNHCLGVKVRPLRSAQSLPRALPMGNQFRVRIRVMKIAHALSLLLIGIDETVARSTHREAGLGGIVGSNRRPPGFE